MSSVTHRHLQVQYVCNSFSSLLLFQSHVSRKTLSLPHCLLAHVYKNKIYPFFGEKHFSSWPKAYMGQFCVVISDVPMFVWQHLMKYPSSVGYIQ